MLRIVEEQRKIHEERMKLEQERQRQQKEEQKIILGKGSPGQTVLLVKNPGLDCKL